MFANERRAKILEILSHRSSVTVAELVELFQVSLESVRRDLEYLEKQGELKRVHGGALSIHRIQSYTGLTERSAEHREEKRRISAAALEYIHEGDRIALDTGSTSFELAAVLCESFRELTVLTNSLEIFQVLSQKEGFQVILAGGYYLPGEKSFYGHFTQDMIQGMHVSAFFLAPSAISLDFGLSEHIRELVEIQRAMIKIADQVIVLADSSKFETCASLRVCPLSRSFVYLTDENLPDEYWEAYQNASLHLIKK